LAAAFPDKRAAGLGQEWAKRLIANWEKMGTAAEVVARYTDRYHGRPRRVDSQEVPVPFPERPRSSMVVWVWVRHNAGNALRPLATPPHTMYIA
jgi:hypothetical protein